MVVRAGFLEELVLHGDLGEGSRQLIWGQRRAL